MTCEKAGCRGLRLGFLALGSWILSSALWAGQPQVQQVLPATADPGDEVTLFGTGFGDDGQDHLVVVEGNAGRGAVLRVRKAGPGAITAVVGPVSAPLTGNVRVVVGQGHALSSGRVFPKPHGVYVLRDAGWFWGTEVSVMGPQLAVPSGVPGTIEAEAAASDWSIQLGPQYRNPPVQGTIVIGTGSGPTGGGGDLGGGGGLATAWQSFTFELAYASNQGGAPPTPTLAADLAAILGEVFGDLGLSFSSADDRLSFDHDSDLGLAFGILTLAPTAP